MNENGKSLIFLISQPRSGSTLAQRIIGSHPKVHTQSEPWVLLLPLHAFKTNNIYASYESDLYSSALDGFIKTIPGGNKTYIHEIGRVYSNLYNAILKDNSKNFFLDKTPRYYYIIQELKQYFPKAKFVFLWRNPAAVVASIMNSWTKENWYRLAWHKDDLLLAPNEMISGIKFLGKDAYTFNYENLIRDPATQIKQLCIFLEIDYYDKMIEYGKNNVVKWEFGDQKTINERERPDSSNENNWISGLKRIQFWRVVNDYIDILGSETISEMGYSFDEILDILIKNKPKGNIDQKSMPLSSFLDNTRDTLIDNKRMISQIRSLNESLKLKDEQIGQRSQGLEQLKNELNNAKVKLQQKDELITQIERKLKFGEETLGQQKLTIRHKDELIHQKLEAINNCNDIIIKKEQLLKQKDDIIFSKEELLDHKTQLVNNLNDLIASFQENNKKLISELEERNELLVKKDLLINDLAEKKQLHQSEISKKDLELTEKSNQLEMIIKENERLVTIIAKKESLIKQNAEIIKNKDELISGISETLREKSKQLIGKEEQLKQRDEILKQIEKSYTFKIGKVLLWPIKKILR